MDIKDIPTPSYVCNEDKLKENLQILDRVQKEAGCKILLALKGFAMFGVFPIIRETLRGTAASSLNEARLGKEEFGGEVHLCAPAYSEEDFESYLEICDSIIFNSFHQWEKFKGSVLSSSKKIKAGIRINPEHSEVETEIYDPCRIGSRLGTTLKEFKEEELDGITGIHFHNLCEKNSDALERTLASVEEKFASILKKMEWVNFGGGHHITRPDYDVDKLIRLVKNFREKYRVDVILEPGEAIALNAGVLIASVMDIVKNDSQIAILDASASAHMPDVLEMPYRPQIEGAALPGEKKYLYTLAGPTCLAGDIIGDYSFDKPLMPGDKLVFGDMLHYTMVKNTMFNGVNLPSIGVWSSKNGFKVIRKFGYEDYRSRLS